MYKIKKVIATKNIIHAIRNAKTDPVFQNVYIIFVKLHKNIINCLHAHDQHYCVYVSIYVTILSFKRLINYAADFLVIFYKFLCYTIL